MNYNANAGARQPLGRKVKRVSDVNAMGYNPYTSTSPPSTYPSGDTAMPFPQPQQPNVYSPSAPSGGFNAPPEYVAQPMANPQTPPNVPYGMNVSYLNPANPAGVFAQPMVQDMALQYGQQLASTSSAAIKKEVGRYIPISKLKYYFAVDARYVMLKLKLLLFPFTHSDWSVKYEQDNPIQPRFEINAPDLYIPTMAYITYIFVAGLLLGIQQRFSPEQISVIASSALAWELLELVVYNLTLYITNIGTSLGTLDFLAYSGYKYFGIILSLLLSLIGGKMFYYISLSYIGFALAFYLIRTLKVQILPESVSQNASYYGDASRTIGNKRRLYFLLFVAVVQVVMAWWLSYHLVGTPLAILSFP